MPENVSKTDNFLKAIEKYAEEQRSKIQSEAEDFKQKEISKAEDEGLKEAYVLIQKKMTDIRTKISSELSRAENASRRKTFARRQEIEKQVFADAEQKIIEFTKKKEYLAKLEASVILIAEVLTADDVVLKVKKDDLRFQKQLSATFGRKCTVEATSDIRLGGVIGMSRSMGMLADETLDSKLEAQHDWFCENSGLKVTE